MIAILEKLGFKADPSWTKKKEELICNYEEHEYTLSLQHIQIFACLLEAEILCEKNDESIHVPNLKKILSDLGCEPIEAEEFKEKIQKYIRDNKNEIP